MEVPPVSAASSGWILIALGNVKTADVVLLYLIHYQAFGGKTVGHGKKRQYRLDFPVKLSWR